MFTISINYGVTEYSVGDNYGFACIAFEKACNENPGVTVTLLEDEDVMVKEREVLE